MDHSTVPDHGQQPQPHQQQLQHLQHQQQQQQQQEQQLHIRELDPRPIGEERPHHYIYDGKTDPLYDMSLGHYAACEALVQKKCVPDPSLFVEDWENVTLGLDERDASIMRVFWQHHANLLSNYTGNFKTFGIPIARFRRLMKTEEQVQMISSEVLPLIAQATDLFVTELTMRAWMKARDNSRRTLQQSDIILAASKSEMYDFLIYFLPREQGQEHPQQQPQDARRPSYTDPSFPHMRAPSLAPPLLHAPQPPAEYLPQSHMQLPQVAVDYQTGVSGIYGAPQAQDGGERGGDQIEQRKAPAYSHNLYETISGQQPRGSMRPSDGQLQ